MITSVDLDAVVAEVFPPVREDAWELVARADQLPPPGSWLVWLILAGRGWGKTRTGAELAADHARKNPGSRTALVAATFADGRDTMVEGESGLLAVLRDDELRGGSRDSAWNRSLGELYLANGSQFKIYSSEKPRQLRGPQHHFAWCDEAASWQDAHLGDADDTTWANLMLGLRLGRDPRCVVTTTPKPVKLLRGTSERPGLLAQATTTVTRGSTYDNLANLAPTFRAQVLERYEGTRLGRQELHAELLDDVEGALWARDWIDSQRVVPGFEVGTGGGLVRVVVAVDPAVTSGEDSDETGIVVAGRGADGRAYVLADRTAKMSPDGWGRRVVQAYEDFGADLVVGEANNGGDMVSHVLRTVDQQLPIRLVHASRGKRVRAQPIAALYEQGRVSHIGTFDRLEDQLCSWTPESGDSPDRLDALVWGLTELMLDREAAPIASTDHRLGGRRAR